MKKIKSLESQLRAADELVKRGRTLVLNEEWQAFEEALAAYEKARGL